MIPRVCGPTRGVRGVRGATRWARSARPPQREQRRCCRRERTSHMRRNRIKLRPDTRTTLGNKKRGQRRRGRGATAPILVRVSAASRGDFDRPSQRCMHQMSAFLVSSSYRRTVSTRPSDPASPPNRWCETPTRNAISQINPPATRTRVASARRSMSIGNPSDTIAADLSADALLQQRARHCNCGRVVLRVATSLDLVHGPGYVPVVTPLPPCAKVCRYVIGCET